MAGPLLMQSLQQLFQARHAGVDKPQFYDAYEPKADLGMALAPLDGHPAFGDKNNIRPEDILPPPSYDTPRSPSRLDLSSLSPLARLMALG